MPKFIYQAREFSGAAASGALTAASADEATRMLRGEGKIVVSIREESSADHAVAATGGSKKVKRDDVIYFATQLSVMVETGVPLPEALDAIADQTDHPGLREIIADICDQVKGGMEFSTALERHPKIFGRLFVAMMRASEASGMMGQMLVRVSEYLEQERETRKRIKGAMTYPAFMLSFCVITVVALLAFVLPRFEKIYSTKGATLPAPTRFLLAMSKGIVGYWPFLIVGLAGGIAALVYYLRTPSGRMMVDKIRISLPIIGPMYRKAYLARSLRTLATMVASGVDILDGLDITAQVAGNHYYAKVWTDLAGSVKEGSTLADPLFADKHVPRTISQMVSAGEKTGRLGMVLNRVANFCEEDLKNGVKTVTQMIEPLMIIIMGLLVGGIAISLLLPIFSISKVVAH